MTGIILAPRALGESKFGERNGQELGVERVGVSACRRLGVATRWAIGGIDRAYRSYRNTLIHSFRMIRPFARSVLTPIRPHAGTPIRSAPGSSHPLRDLNPEKHQTGLYRPGK
jgi:hypothetical protein